MTTRHLSKWSLSNRLTALKTVSARIRKSKTDLDELGESADDLAESWSIYADEIKALTGFDIMVEGSTTQFKDLYDIFNGIASVWDDLGENAETTQARVAEILGGTRQYQVISSILNNWKDASGALNSALEADGTSAEALATYMDSIEGRTGQLKAAFEEFSTTVLNSDLVKTGIKILTEAVEGLNKLFKGINDVVGALTGSKAVSDALSRLDDSFNKISESDKKISTLEELIEQYKSLKVNDQDVLSEEDTQKVRNLQKEIVNLIGDQAEGIDLVNGKLSEELTLLGNITKEERERRITGAKAAVTEAEDLIGKFINKDRDDLTGWNISFGTRDDKYNLEPIATVGSNGFETAKVGKFSTKGYNYHFRTAQRAETTSVVAAYETIDTDFKSVEDFINQYEGVRKSYEEISALNKEEDVELRDTLRRYLTTYSEYYSKYTEALNLLKAYTEDTVETIKKTIKDGFIPQKSITSILDEVETKFDTLSDAMADMEETGEISVKTYKAMVEAGLTEYLEQQENAFVLTGNALDVYTKKLIDSYVAEVTLASGAQSAKNAIENLQNLKLVLSMLSATARQNYEKEQIENQKKALEDEKDALEDNKDAIDEQKDALNEQADKYKELIDLRKELLEQYESELKYQKELERRQKNVAKLQARLAVSRLDTSAAGRARTRELEDELETEQNDLEDFTLEHAIDVVTDNLDKQYDEYQKWIDQQIQGLDDQIQGIEDAINNLTNAINALGDKNSSSSFSAASSIINSAETWSSIIDQEILRLKGILEQIEAKDTKTTIIYKPSKANDSSLEVWESEYGNRLVDTRNGKTGTSPYRTVENSHGGSGGSFGNNKKKQTSKNYQKAGKYHSGGIVGSRATIKSTEEFAKLLKGEFVSTPTMMRKFMNETLPNVISAASNRVEVNTPLITIQCDNVTTETLPHLEDIVTKAANKVKKELGDALNRTGYHKTSRQIGGVITVD